MNKKINKINGIMIAFLGLISVAACAPQSTPSMMNASKPTLSAQTEMKQIPIKNVNNVFLSNLAEHYSRYGVGGLKLALSFDPEAKDYTALHAFKDLERIKSNLGAMNIQNVMAETIKAQGQEPTLFITYEMITAQAPQDCGVMPGLEGRQTGRQIGDYRFGCSVDRLMAEQIYRPSDLAGNDSMDSGDGRRAANSVEHYRVVTEREATQSLDVLQREDISSQ